MSPEFHQSLQLFIILLLSISLHEFGHAKMADVLGDPVPRLQGRVTLVPWAHWDLLGTIIIPGLMVMWPVLFGGTAPVALIGWGKPVQVSLPNPRTRTRDDILTTLAGPAMNLVIAVGAAVLGGLALRVAGSSAADPVVVENAVKFFIYALMLNVALIAFNLIPIPPLDGSRVMRRMVGMSDETFAWLARHGFLIMLVLINLPAIGGMTVLGWLAWPLQTAIGEPLIALMLTIGGIAR